MQVTHKPVARQTADEGPRTGLRDMRKPGETQNDQDQEDDPQRLRNTDRRVGAQKMRSFVPVRLRIGPPDRSSASARIVAPGRLWDVMESVSQKHVLNLFCPEF
jgi:hypothetical protein